MDGPVAPRFGLPTSVGDLPFDDHLTAVEFMLQVQPSFPTIPRSRNAGASFAHQIASFVRGARATGSGRLEIASAKVPRNGATLQQGTADVLDRTALETLSGPFEGVSVFLDALRSRSLPDDDDFLGVRLEVLGPVSTALGLRCAGMEDDTALQMGVDIAALTGVALLDRVRRVVGQKAVAVMMCEPGLIGAMHPTFPLLSSQVHRSLVEVVDALDTRAHAGPLLIGAHVPGRTDWSTVISSGVSILSVPIGGNLEGCAAHLQPFLDAGGMVAWGAVPVDEPLGSTDEILWRRLGSLWCSLVGAGIDPFQLRAQSLISMADGLGHFGEPQLANAYSLVESLSTRVRRQAAGTRLSLGA